MPEVVKKKRNRAFLHYLTITNNNHNSVFFLPILFLFRNIEKRREEKREIRFIYSLQKTSEGVKKMIQSRLENEQFNSLPNLITTDRSRTGFITTDRPDSSQVVFFSSQNKIQIRFLH